MRLPNAKNVHIPDEKLIHYLLSDNHPIGKFKAKYFKKLGFTALNIEELKNALLKIAQENEIEIFKETVYGTNYVVQGAIVSPTGKKVVIRTIWHVGSKELKPRFVTATPGIMNSRKRIK